MLAFTIRPRAAVYKRKGCPFNVPYGRQHHKRHAGFLGISTTYDQYHTVLTAKLSPILHKVLALLFCFCQGGLGGWGRRTQREWQAFICGSAVVAFSHGQCWWIFWRTAHDLLSCGLVQLGFLDIESRLLSDIDSSRQSFWSRTAHHAMRSWFYLLESRSKRFCWMEKGAEPKGNLYIEGWRPAQYMNRCSDTW